MTIDRRLGTAVIINILNLLDLVVTLIAFQLAHIEYTTAEGNPLMIICYSEFLAGNIIPVLLFVLIKILASVFITVVWFHYKRNFIFALAFGIIFSIYLISTIGWILLIFGAQLPSPLAVSFLLLWTFGVSFVIYYSPSELKDFLWERTLIPQFYCDMQELLKL